MLYIDRATCAGCATCLDVCPAGAISLDEKEGVAAIDQALCTECLACVDVCPTGAVRRVESSERVPVGRGEIVEGEVIERQVIPAPASSPPTTARPAGSLATLLGAALTFVGNWLLPRFADAFLDAVERRPVPGTSPGSSAGPRRSASSPLPEQKGSERSGRGRRRRQRRRGQ